VTLQLRLGHPRHMFGGVKLVLSIFMALALLLTPAGMTGSGAAAASTHEMTMSTGMEHCADQPESGDEQPADSCCVVACTALLAQPVRLAEVDLPTLPHPAASLEDHRGLRAEAATPPPRSRS
jgi:hypothetical protein